MLHLQALSAEHITAIYHTHMQRDFAPDEIKPLSAMLKPMALGHYRGYGLFEDNTLCGYALFLMNPNGHCALLDYFAVVADKRSAGYGSRFLTLLQKELSDLDGLLLEVERVSSATNGAEKAIRRRRIAFYKRCGVRMTGLYSNLFGVDFSVMFLPCGRDIPDGRLYIECDGLYRRLFAKPIWERKVALGWRANVL